MPYRLLMLLTLVVAGPLAAEQQDPCSVTLEATDSMKFSAKELRVPASCEEVTLTLVHTGKLPARAMGHNIVIASRSDMKGLIADSFAAGFDNHFVAPGDTRPYAASKVIGGGESTSVSFSTQSMSTDGDYVFFCAAPGHWSMMQGSFTLY